MVDTTDAQTKDGQISIDGNRLKRLRRQHGLSQDALADACGRQQLSISIATIKRAETGKAITYRTLKILADFFAVDVSELQPADEQQGAGHERLAVVMAIKITAADAEAPIMAGIRQFSPLFIERQGAYITAGFRKYVKLPEADSRSRTLVKLQQLLAEHPGSLLSPVFCLLTLATVKFDGSQYRLPGQTVKQLTEQALMVPANHIIVGEQLKFLYDLKFDFLPLQPVSPTSAQQHTEWWVLQGVSGQPKSPLALYCREKELQKLTAQIDISLQQQRLTMNCVAGDSGMGKTRMLDELSNLGETPSLRVIRLDAEQHETNWRALLQHKLDVPELTAAEVAQQLMATGKRSVLLLIDNVHLCASEALELLAAIAADLQNCPIAIVVTTTYRNSDRVIRNLNADSFVALSHLTRADAAVLTASFPEHSREWLEQSINRSNGVPFYLNLLLEQTGLKDDQLPESIQLVLEDQLFSLSDSEQKAMQYLALAGTSLPLNILYILAGQTSLKTLTQSQLVRSNKDDQLEIANRLIAELVCEGMADEQKKQHHQRLATVVESNLLDGLMPQADPSRERLRCQWLQQQFAAAGNHFRSVIYQLRYARQLIDANSYIEAEAQLLAAKDLLAVAALKEHCQTGGYSVEQCDDMRLDLLFYLANVYKMRYGWYSPVITDLYAEILALCDQTKSYQRKVNGLFGIWTIALTDLDIPLALQYAKEAYQLSAQLEDPACKMQALTALSNTCFWAGRSEDTYHYASQALQFYNPELLEQALSVEGQDPRMLAWCFMVLSAAQQQDPRASDYLQEMVATSRGVGHSFSLAIALQAGAWFYWKQRDPVRTLEFAGELEALTAENVFPFYQGVAALFKGWAAYQLEPAQQHLETIVNGYQQWLSNAGFKLTHSLYAALVGDVLLSDKQQSAAVALLQEAITTAEQQGTDCYLPELYFLMHRSGDQSRNWLSAARSHNACTPQQSGLFILA